MELVWTIYFIEVICQPMLGLGLIMVMVTFAATTGYFMRMFIDEEPYHERLDKVPFGKIAVICSTLLILSNFIPSKNGAYTMLGAYGIQSVAETIGKNQEVQQIGKRTLSIVETALTKHEKELKVEQKIVDKQKQ